MKSVSIKEVKEKSLFIFTLNDTNLVDIYVTEVSKRLLAKGMDSVYNAKTFRLFYLAEGQCEIKTDLTSFVSTAKNLTILSPNCQYNISVLENSVLYTLDFLGTKASEYTERMGIVSDFPFLPLEQNNKLAEDFETCLQECTLKPYASDLTAINFFYGIAKPFIFENYSKSDIEVPCKEIYIKNAIQYINANYSNPEITLNSTAAYLNISPSYCARIFKSIVKTSFTKYLTYKRIKVAASLMAQGETSIKKIAEQVGFRNQFYFSAVWKKYNHVSPSAHLNQLR